MGKFDIFNENKIKCLNKPGLPVHRLLNFFHDFPPGHMTLIVGPNGCGKSFLALNIAMATSSMDRKTVMFSCDLNEELRLMRRPDYDKMSKHFAIINSHAVSEIIETIKSLKSEKKTAVIILDIVFYGDYTERRIAFEGIKNVAMSSNVSVVLTNAINQSPIVDRSPGYESTLSYCADMIVRINKDYPRHEKMQLLNEKDRFRSVDSIELDYEPDRASIW